MSAQSPQSSSSSSLGFAESVTLLAVLISLVALSTDAMMPALQDIGDDLGNRDHNANQLVIIMLFLGLGLGQLIYGPLSDSYGRKRPIYVGLGIFSIGCLLSVLSWDFQSMLLGRFLQGLGAAGPRIVTVALIRDQHEGRAMARIMSVIMAVFIIVPAIAPALGQSILLVAHWRAIFLSFLGLAIISGLWFAIRQRETLAADDRIPFSGARILSGLKDCLSHRIALGYILTAGFIFSAFVAYLSTAQQIFQKQYELEELFPIYFAVLALAIGTGSLINARLVMHFGMRSLSWRALIVMTGLSFLFSAYALLTGGTPPLLLYMGFFMLIFVCLGLLFGNFNALAMEPLGHIAGLASAVIGSLTTLMSLVLGGLVGQAYNGTVIPLVVSFAVMGCAAIGAMIWAERGRPRS